MILNLKTLNEFIPYRHFKIETINSILNLIIPSCFMTKIKDDIKDAHYSIPILTEHQTYNRKLYQFICLPNSLCSGPRNFTKLLKPLLDSLKKLKVTVVAYTDDLIIDAQSFCQYSSNIINCVGLLSILGFVIRPTKTIFIPAHCIEYFGFVLNSKAMTISLTDSKNENFKILCNEILFSKSWAVAKLLG